MSIDKDLLQLEIDFNKLTRHMVPGTMLERVLLDNTLCRKAGLEIVRPEKEAQLVWCLALGHMRFPKKFFYANTVAAAVEKAQQWVGDRLKEKAHDTL
jgi:hypothetical protein